MDIRHNLFCNVNYRVNKWQINRAYGKYIEIINTDSSDNINRIPFFSAIFHLTFQLWIENSQHKSSKPRETFNNFSESWQLQWAFDMEHKFFIHWMERISKYSRSLQMWVYLYQAKEISIIFWIVKFNLTTIFFWKAIQLTHKFDYKLRALESTAFNVQTFER